MKNLLILTLLGVVLLCGCVEEGVGNCCPKCTDPNAVLIKAPGGECQCMSKCPINAPHLLEEVVGSNCCTDKECSLPESTTTTTLGPITCDYDPRSDSCVGSCGVGTACSVSELGFGDPVCSCMTPCSNIFDIKQCQYGGCPDPDQYCGVLIQGGGCGCTSQQYYVL